MITGGKKGAGIACNRYSGIHVREAEKDVDDRDDPGHDER
jgi:hypothetical protein